MLGTQLGDFIDVIDYLVDLIGIDHVGIGTDFPIGQPEQFYERIATGSCHRRGLGIKFPFPMVLPKGIQTPGEFPNITQSLLDRGYDKESIQKIMGQNFFNLFQTVWN